MRVLTIAGRILAAVLGLSVLCIVLLLAFFNPNAYRSEIEAWVSQQTGLRFTLDGELGWHLGSSLQLSLPHTLLADAPAGDIRIPGSGFAEWQQARVAVRLWPLLAGHLIIDAVEVQGLRLMLKRDAQGRGNWQDLLQRFSSNEGASGRVTFERLEHLQLQDSEVQFEDATTQRHSTLQLSKVQAQSVRFDQAIALHLQGRALTHTDAQSIDMPFQLDTQLQANAALDQVHVYQLQLSGSLTAQGVAGDQGLHALPLAIHMPQAEWNGVSQRLHTDALTLTVGTAQASAQITMVSLQDLQLDATLQVTVPQLREWAQSVGVVVPATRDATVLQSLQAQLHAWGDTQAMQVKVTSLQLDQTQASGIATLVFADTPRYTLALQADQLNLDHYLPVEQRSAMRPSRRAATPSSASPVPIEWLRSLHVQGSLRIDQAQFQGLHARRLQIDLEGS